MQGRRVVVPTRVPPLSQPWTRVNANPAGVSVPEAGAALFAVPETSVTDPVEVIDKHRRRVTSFHLKDVDKAGKAATCGDGILDFAAIRKAAQRIESPLFYVECEGAPAGDPAREPVRALKYLRSIGW